MLDRKDILEELAAPIVSHGICMDEQDLEELTIFPASNAPVLRGHLKGLRYVWP